MTNPTLGWTTSGPHTITIAGANPTVAEILTALNARIVASATKWSVSDYNSGNGTLEIKRNASVGTVTGELATVRILIFGGSAPHANALAGGHTGGTTTGLYVGLSVDANTTGPSASYAAGAPYATKYTRGGLICTPSTGLTASAAVRLTLIESDDAFGFVLSDTSGTHTYLGGRLGVRATDDSLIWVNMPSGGTWSLSSSPASMSIAAAFPIPPLTIATNSIKMTYWDTVSASARQCGRLMSFIYTGVEMALGASGNSMAMTWVPLHESAQATGQTPGFLGFFRQIRLGPIATHLAHIRNGATVLQATHIFGGSASGVGMWLDENP